MTRSDYGGFPNIRPDVPFLRGTYPPEWKSRWHNRDLWRLHPLFSRKSRLSSLFPGIGIGAVLFAAISAYEHFEASHGEQALEAQRLEKFMHDREHRLNEHGIHVKSHH